VLHHRRQRLWQRGLRLLLIGCLTLPLLFDTATACRRTRRRLCRSSQGCLPPQTPVSCCPPACSTGSHAVSTAPLPPTPAEATPTPATADQKHSAEADPTTPPMRVEHIPVTEPAPKFTGEQEPPPAAADATPARPTPANDSPVVSPPQAKPAEPTVEEPKPLGQPMPVDTGSSFLERMAEQIAKQVKDAVTPPLAAAEFPPPQPEVPPAAPVTSKAVNLFDELSGIPSAEPEASTTQPTAPPANFFDELSPSSEQPNTPTTEPVPPDQPHPAAENSANPNRASGAVDPSSQPADSTGPVSFDHQPQRLWIDASEKHSTLGTLTQIHDEKVRILKANGRYTTVLIQQLSDHDRRYVAVMAEGRLSPALLSQR